MGEEYDVLVSHIATGPFYRASVRILTKGEDKIPDLTASSRFNRADLTGPTGVKSNVLPHRRIEDEKEHSEF